MQYQFQMALNMMIKELHYFKSLEQIYSRINLQKRRKKRKKVEAKAKGRKKNQKNDYKSYLIFMPFIQYHHFKYLTIQSFGKII